MLNLSNWLDMFWICLLCVLAGGVIGAYYERGQWTGLMRTVYKTLDDILADMRHINVSR